MDGTDSGDYEYPAWASPQQLQGMVDGERVSKRKQSMECSAVDVRISKTKLIQNLSSKYTVYVIDVNPGIKSWCVERRFNDFYFLDQQLRKYNRQSILPPLPNKVVFGSSTSTRVVEERREQLENYIQRVVLIPSAWNRSDLVRFLDNENSSMMFVWNFERMRKMQEV